MLPFIEIVEPRHDGSVRLQTAVRKRVADGLRQLVVGADECVRKLHAVAESGGELIEHHADFPVGVEDVGIVEGETVCPHRIAKGDQAVVGILVLS